MVILDYCLDTNGNQITNLSQWDMGQKVVIPKLGLTKAPLAYFHNKMFKNGEAISALTEIVDDYVYIEIPNMRHNLEALEDVVKFIYENIQYAEFNTKPDYCNNCGYDGEIIVNGDLDWECPQCHCKDKKLLKTVIYKLYPKFPEGLSREEEILVLFDRLCKDNRMDELRTILYEYYKVENSSH